MIKIKSYKVDGETRVGVWVDSVFKEEVDTYSGFNTRQARQYLMNKYSNKNNN